jgi:hypothetical protein
MGELRGVGVTQVIRTFDFRAARHELAFETLEVGFLEDRPC